MNDPFKLPAPFGSNTTNNKQKTAQQKNFIEAFREQGQAATTGVASEAVNQLFGTTQRPQSPDQAQPFNPNMLQNPGSQPPFNFAEFLKQREQKLRQQERGMADQQRRQETVIFHQKEEYAKREIESIKAELLQIIKSTQGISADILAAEQSVMTTTVEVGIYQLTFFQRIRKLLSIARKNLADSAHWLEEFNTRKRAKSYYWGQVKKSGTKYQLSSERSVVTQTG